MKLTRRGLFGLLPFAAAAPLVPRADPAVSIPTPLGVGVGSDEGWWHVSVTFTASGNPSLTLNGTVSDFAMWTEPIDVTKPGDTVRNYTPGPTHFAIKGEKL